MVKDLLGRKVDISDSKTPVQEYTEKLKFILKAGWMFNHPVEKIILILMITWAIYSFVKYIIL